VIQPNALIIQDPTLLHLPGLFDGLVSDGMVLINSADPNIPCPAGRRLAVPATELAMKYVRRPLPNAALLGAFVAQTGLIHLESLLAAIREKFPGETGEANAAAAHAAWDCANELIALKPEGMLCA
jgi:pyruvate ferredoxin oxidoreductase gamma subunit